MPESTFLLTSELLAPVLHRVFGPHAAPADFEIKALKPGAGNPTSLGVYRVHGHTTDGLKFSVVVKHLADGQPIMDASNPRSWNYWKREIEFFESPLAKRIPKDIDYPEYLGQSTLTDGTVLFWNSDLGDLEKSAWTWQECLHASQLVASLNSIDISDESKYEWLNRDQLEGWIELRETYFVPLHQVAIDCALSKPSTAKAFELYGKYLPMQVQLKDLLNTHRRVFAHGDFNLNNLVPRSAALSNMIALDWQLCGLAAIGSEVAALFNTAHELGVISASQEQFEEICAVYVEAFNQMNPSAPCTMDEVRLVVAAQGFTILSGVGFYIAHPDPSATAEQNAAKIQNMIDYFTNGPMLIYAEVLRELSGL